MVSTLELFENKLSSAINELKVVVSSSIADSLKTKSHGGSEGEPGCSGMYVPVEESVAENNYCKTNSALNRGNLTEFEYDSDRAIPDTPPPEREPLTRSESVEPRADLHIQ